MAARSSPNLLSGKDENEVDQKHGSIRKVLHSLVGNDSLLGISARMLDRPKHYRVEDDLNPYQAYFREYALISEYNILCQHLIPGLYMIPSAKYGNVWFGVLFIRSGLYRGGIFRFSLLISENFPDSTPPRVVFETKIFHPCINDKTNELNVSRGFPEWSETDNHIWQVLEYTSNIFDEISTENAENPVAVELFEKDIESYKKIIEECVEESKRNVFNRNVHDDAHYFRFEEFNETLHYDASTALKAGQCITNNTLNCGLSWVKEGTIKPCSLTPYEL